MKMPMIMNIIRANMKIGWKTIGKKVLHQVGMIWDKEKDNGKKGGRTILYCLSSWSKISIYGCSIRNISLYSTNWSSESSSEKELFEN